MWKTKLATVRRRIRAIPLFLRDKSVSFWKRAIVIFAIVYLFLPIDIIPPIIPIVGFLDDLVLWMAVFHILGEELDSYDLGDPGNNSSEKYRDKTVIDVSFDVKNEEEEND